MSRNTTMMSNITMMRLTILSKNINKIIKMRVRIKEAIRITHNNSNQAILISQNRDKLYKNLKLSSPIVKTKLIKTHHIERFL